MGGILAPVPYLTILNETFILDLQQNILCSFHMKSGILKKFVLLI